MSLLTSKRASMKAVLLMLPVVGCTKPSTPMPSDAQAASSTLRPLSSSAVASASATREMQPPATALPSSCSIVGAFRGTVLGAPVYMRLTQDGGRRVYGRYFYEKVGIDIALEGSFDGTLTLREGKTARFEGTCKDGRFSGTWHGAKEGPFELAAVAAGSVQIATKHRTTRKRAKHPDQVVMHPECTFKETWFELFGLEGAKVEERLNRQNAGMYHPSLRPIDAKELARCETGFELEYGEHLEPMKGDLATITRTGYGDWGGAHPTNALDYEQFTVDLRTGDRVHSTSVFKKDPTRAVLACFSNTKVDDLGRTAESFAEFFKREQFSLGPNGIHFYAAGFPHVAASMTGDGPTISYAVLLRDGYLRADSPVKRAWEGQTPAPKGAAVCAAAP